jgi:hypothetical protein
VDAKRDHSRKGSARDRIPRKKKPGQSGTGLLVSRQYALAET